MPQVFYGGDNAMSSLVFGEKHPATLAALEQSMVQMHQHYSQYLNTAAQAFFSNTQELYDRFNSAEALALARAAVRKMEGVYDLQTIRPLYELAELQSANPTNQRWIMAQPDLRRLYHEQRLDGFADNYEDMFPHTAGDAHYDYRQVVSGVVQPVVGNPDYDWEHVEWLGDVLEGDRELTLTEKLNVIEATWPAIQMVLAQGKDDPTILGGKR